MLLFENVIWTWHLLQMRQSRRFRFDTLPLTAIARGHCAGG